MHRFEGFMKGRRKDLGRIAHATQGEMEVDDLIQEAWIIAAEVADDLGEPFDFANPDHQDKLLAWMYARFVKFADKTVRYATKLDRGWDDDSEQTAGKAIASLLSGPESDDPLVRELIENQAAELMERVRASYSQAAAYVILLARVEWDVGDLADLLWVCRETARRRLERAARHAAIQPSCFDGVEAIPEDFAPWRRRWWAGYRYVTPEGQFMFWPVPDPGLRPADAQS